MNYLEMRKRRQQRGSQFAYLDSTTSEFLSQLELRVKTSGMSLKQIGDKVGVTPVSVQSWISGKNYPSVKHLVRLAELLGFDLRESVNWKWYKGHIRIKSIRNRIEDLMLDDETLSRAVNYPVRSVRSIIHSPGPVSASLQFIGRLLEVLDAAEKEFWS